MFDKLVSLYEYKKKEYEAILTIPYIHYTNKVSRWDMAASFECCIFLLTLYDYLRPLNILDLGSGFSSYTLRKFRSLRGLNTEIISVDSDSDWLIKSSEFTSFFEVSNDNFLMWKDIEHNLKPFDLIFFDIDRTAKRVNYYDIVFEKCASKGCFILIDDYHKNVLRKAVAPLVKKYDFMQRELTELKDKAGRFQLLLYKKDITI